jgi:membrane protease YdiL (CAAX protease family)
MNQHFSVTDSLVAILVIIFVVLFPHFGLIPIPFGYTIPILIVIWLTLKRTKENFDSVGFSFRKFELKSVWIGAVSAILLFLSLNYVLFPLIKKVIYLPDANLESFKFIRHHFINYLFIVIMGWVVGGVYEELVFHGFIFTRLEKMTNIKYMTQVSFIITNVVFGLYHVQLGPQGMLNAFFCGCAYQALMIRFNRNIWYAIFFHAFFDTIALSLIFLGYW